MSTIKSLLDRTLILMIMAAFLAGCDGAATDYVANNEETAVVKTVTAITSVSGTGSVLPIQSVTAVWQTSGTVAEVKIKPGDQVKAGAVLMTLKTAGNAGWLQAQVELSNAVNALNELLNPSAATIAAAQQAVAQDLQNLQKARKTLVAVQTPAIDYYQDRVEAARDALLTAEQNAAALDIGSLPVQLRQAQEQLATATNIYNDAKTAFEKCPACIKVYAGGRLVTWQEAVNSYTDALNKVEQLQIQIDQAQRQNANSVATAQEKLASAQANLEQALRGPDAITLQIAQAAVAVAEAKLAESQATLSKLLNGADPLDVLAAQARVTKARDVLEAFTLTAPIDGTVLRITCQRGDAVSAGTAAVTLANQSRVRLEATVDQSDIVEIQTGDPVTITIDALPDLSLAATVTWIDPIGQTSQGLTKYTVRAETAEAYPEVLIGMTGSMLAIVDTLENALAVPLQAVGYDDEGEYVKRLLADGRVERVPVQSGNIQGSLIVVAGDLRAGDRVQLAQTNTATAASGQRGGFFGLFGMGGGVPPEAPAAGRGQP